MLYLRLAWRNLWRNKRRTLIAVSSVLFAVFFALIMRGMQSGSYDYMIESAVRLSTGYLQVHAPGYWRKQSLDLSFPLAPELWSRVLCTPHVTAAIPRLQAFALASSLEATRGAEVWGFDPGKEDRLNQLSRKLVQGAYPDSSSAAVLIGEGLSRYLHLSVGDTIVLYGQGFHGVTAAGKFPIGGIVHLPSPELDRGAIYMPLPLAQWLFGMPERINVLSIMVDAPASLPTVMHQLKTSLGRQYEIMSWSQLMPELVQAIAVDNAGGLLMVLILYIIIGFGLFGTMMVMTIERRREFGVLLSVGMSRLRLTFTTLLESLFLSAVGICTGAALAFPLMFYYSRHPLRLTGEAADAMAKFGLDPVLPVSIEPGIFFSQALIVLVLALLVSLYPAMVISRIDPVRAIRA